MIPWGENNLWLFTIDEYYQLPDSFELTSISGHKKKKGIDFDDFDTRGGYLAWGVVDPNNHPEAELFLTFMLIN